jgi:GxxExxY protein
MKEIYFKEESYKIIGLCMEVHRTLGMGFKEATYKDALEIELQENAIPYDREQKFTVEYKNRVLSSYYVADFVV